MGWSDESLTTARADPSGVRFLRWTFADGTVRELGGRLDPPEGRTGPGGYGTRFGIRQVIVNPRLAEAILVWGPGVWSQSKDPALAPDGVHWSRARRAVMTDLTWRFLADDPEAARWPWRGA